MGGLFFLLGFLHACQSQPDPKALEPQFAPPSQKPIEQTRESAESEGASIALVQSAAWRDWVQKYGSSSPFLAIQKNRPEEYQMTREHLDRVLAGNHRVRFSPPLSSSRGPVGDLDLIQFDASRRFELQLDGRRRQGESRQSREDSQKLSRRFSVIREQMQNAIARRAPNELQIFFVGETHALDLYFSQFLNPDLSDTDPMSRSRREVLYVSPPVTAESIFYTPEFYEFVSLWRGTPVQPETFDQNSSIYVPNFLARLAFNQRLRSGMVPIEALFEERLEKLGAIVFMDWHYLNSPQVFNEMPGASSLKSLGFDRVSFFLESLKFSEEYSLDRMERTYRVQMQHFLSDEDREFERRYRPEVYSFLEKGFVMNSSLQSLHQKLKSYQSAGLNLHFRGLEEVELW